MAHVVAGLFTNSKRAGEAIAELKQQGFTKDISVIAKDWDDTEVKTHQVKQDPSDGAVGGAATGAVIGGLAGLIAGVSTLALPGIGTVFIAGPLAGMLTVTGVAGGAVAGGLVGALVDAGIPDERARFYEDSIERGDVLVAVNVNHESEDIARSILEKHNVIITDTTHNFAQM